VGVVALVLIACAVVLVAGAEWPRLARRLEGDKPVRRKRRRRKVDLTLVEGETGTGDRDAFERSVAHDLENLPVLGDPDDRSRR
jgi:hypothetical protein